MERPAQQGQNIRLITVDQIFYFQADNKYTQVVATEARPLIKKSLREMMDELEPDLFWQIHRSTIVNVNWIAGVHRDFEGRLRVKLKDRPESLAVSEPYEHLFRQT
jgi:DNA-binding LytR/AlgR family response regulator